MIVERKEEVDNAPWPEILHLEYPGLHFNLVDGSSEDADRESQRLQRLHVGLLKETASTCIGVNGGGGAGARAAVAKVSRANQDRGSSCQSRKGGGGGGPPKRRILTRRRPLESLSHQEQAAKGRNAAR